jgi:hypothetical protein
MASGLKHCNDCDKIKPLSEFSTYKENGYRRYRSCCKLCASRRTLKWLAVKAAAVALTLSGCGSYATQHGLELTAQACEQGNDYACRALPEKIARAQAEGGIVVGAGTYSTWGYHRRDHGSWGHGGHGGHHH